MRRRGALPRARALATGVGDGLVGRLRRRGREPVALEGPAGEAWAVVADLPLRQRQVVVLRYVADLTEADIASSLGISRSTVSSTLADARRTLGRLLAENIEEVR